MNKTISTIAVQKFIINSSQDYIERMSHTKTEGKVFLIQASHSSLCCNVFVLAPSPTLAVLKNSYF